jgi:hypothetical protein
MKKGSKQLIELIYRTDEKSSLTLLEDAIRHATSKYDDDKPEDDYGCGCFTGEEKTLKYFKEIIKDWRFVREARIKGADYKEVCEHFQNPDIEGAKEEFLKEWEADKEKQKAKDLKANQK